MDRDIPDAASSPVPYEAQCQKAWLSGKALEILNEDVTRWLNSIRLMVFGKYLSTNIRLFAAICHCLVKPNPDKWFWVIWNMVNQQGVAFFNLPKD